MGLIIYGFFVEPYDVKVSKADIQVEGLPESLDGLTICHLSDTHTYRHGKLERLLEGMLSGMSADLCVITGDLLQRHSALPVLRSLVEACAPRLGAFAVVGNGDYKLEVPMPELAKEMKKVGIDLLLNESRILSLNDENLLIIGVEDPYGGMDDLSRAMSDLPSSGFRLLLAHSPDIVMQIAGREIDLALCGHTHGGQIRLPIIGPLWFHCRYHLGISNGYFGAEDLSRASGNMVERTQMYVSRGLAGSIVRVRFLCPPEVALITLRRKFEQ